ncbi:MAG: NUDIX domain-containing protein [Bradymonadales bacterium]|jgi:8-oxo-dGTP diphosphatase
MPRLLEKYCPYCGAKRAKLDYQWPKECGCGVITYRNPVPVVNALLPIYTDDSLGILCIKRAIEPCKGEWALPGGYLELAECWQDGAVRELYEESGIMLNVENDIKKIICVDSNPKRDRLLLFALCKPQKQDLLQKLQTNSEVTDFKLVYAPEELAFPPHTRSLELYFLNYHENLLTEKDF